jgi:hypothetical protein
VKSTEYQTETTILLQVILVRIRREMQIRSKMKVITLLKSIMRTVSGSQRRWCDRGWGGHNIYSNTAKEWTKNHVCTHYTAFECNVLQYTELLKELDTIPVLTWWFD